MTKKVLMVSTESFSLYQFGLPQARALREHGYDVTFACSGWSYPDAPSHLNEVRAEGWRVEQVPLGRRLFAPSDIVALWKIFWMLRRDGYNILHTQNSKAGVIGRLAATLARTPVIIHTAHDFAFRSARNRPLGWLLRFIERCSARMCDVLLFVSHTERSYAIANKIAPYSKLVMVGQGVDLGDFHEGRLPPDVRVGVCRRYGLNPTAPIVGSVARLVPHKGHECLLRAAAVLLKDLPGVQFLIAGGGPEQKSLQELAEELDINQSVTFTGFLPNREDVLAIFSSIDVFALPTKKEGFGVVFVEAMASALPVVAFDIAPVNTIVKNGETGILVLEDDAEALAKALLHILTNADIRESMAIAGQNRASSLFDLQQALVRIVDVFDRLCLMHEVRGPIAERFIAS